MDLFRYLSTASILIPLGVGFYRYRAYRQGYALLLFYLLVTTITEGIGVALHLNREPNLLVYNIFTILEATLLGGLFIQYLPKSRWIISFAVVVFGIFATIKTLQAPHAANSLVWGLENILLIVFSLIYFYSLFLSTEEVSLTHLPMFWVASGILMFFSGTLCVYVSTEFIIKNQVLLKPLWDITRWLNILFHLIIAVGLWKGRP